MLTGANFSDVVRVDQYYTTVRALHRYHEVRREVFKGVIPSTSNLHQRFSRTDQTIEMQVMAAVPGSGLTVKHETFTPSYNISPMSGYSPALSVGDFGFVPGQTAEARENCNADGACFRNATLVQAAATPVSSCTNDRACAAFERAA